MSQEIKVWQISNKEELKEIAKEELDLEDRLEKWLSKDISVVDDRLLVIGKQVPTDFGKRIDILCLDDSGDVVILELKKDKTPRDVVAQALDYASWVKDLSRDRVLAIATELYGTEEAFEAAFTLKFKVDEIPETLNEHHKMLIVCSEIDGSTERIVGYLSEEYGVDINVVTFQCFCDKDGKELLGRVFLIEPDEVERNKQRKNTGKRTPPLSSAEWARIAEENGVAKMFQALCNGLSNVFDFHVNTLSSVGFIGIIGEYAYPVDSDNPNG